MPEIISANDLALYNRAQARLAAAQDTVRFVSDHITAVYQLNGTEQVDLGTGVITRPTSAPTEAPE